LQDKVTVKDIEAFSFTTWRKPLNQSRFYLQATRSRFQGPSADMKFAKSLALIVNKKDGCIMAGKGALSGIILNTTWRNLPQHLSSMCQKER